VSTSRSNLPKLADRQPADARECERLSRRLYDLTAEWEPAVARQRELRSDLVERADALDRRGRQERLDELLELSLRVHEIERSLVWTDQRRNLVLERLFEPRRQRR
jgi:hypothetical protein